MQPVMNSTEAQTARLIASIKQIGAPYQDRLVTWLRTQIGQDLSDVERGIHTWLTSLDMERREGQLQFATIQMVVETTCQVFGDKSA